jgi:hypothetical protein
VGKTALGVLLLTGCSAGHLDVRERAGQEHGCSEDKVHVFASNSGDDELGRVYRNHRLGGTHRWRDVTEAVTRLPAAWPRRKAADDPCSDDGIDEMRAAGVSSSAIAFACDGRKASPSVPRATLSPEAFARGVDPAWEAEGQPVLTAASRCTEPDRAKMQRFGMSASAIRAACDQP